MQSVAFDISFDKPVLTDVLDYILPTGKKKQTKKTVFFFPN